MRKKLSEQYSKIAERRQILKNLKDLWGKNNLQEFKLKSMIFPTFFLLLDKQQKEHEIKTLYMG